MRYLLFLFTFLVGLNLGAQDIFAAVRSGDPETLKAEVKAGGHINDIESQGLGEKTPLMVAVDQDDPVMVKALIDLGADLNFKTPYLGNTFLMYLAQYPGEKALEIFALGLKKGAKIDDKDGEGRTALMYAAMEGQKVMTEALIKAKAGINFQVKTGETALFYAVAGDYEEIAELLLKAGADASLMRTEGRITSGPLHIAVEKGNQSMVELLLKNKADVNIRTKGLWGGRTPLIIAVENRDVEMTALLLKYRGSVKILDDSGSSPLDYAIQGGGDELNQIQELLSLH